MDSELPCHIAVIMDGNGRWALQRGKPRVAGHRAGLQTARTVLEACVELGIGALTLFAFSSENWRRPKREVAFLMDLFSDALGEELGKLNEHQVRLNFIGDRSAFPRTLQQKIQRAEAVTAANTGTVVSIAANYGGRWDICQAAQVLARDVKNGLLHPDDIDAERLQRNLALGSLPEPDLFIRTGGEQRISNFLLWYLAYTELYFTDCLWPDFDRQQFDLALQWYQTRQRRFGMTGEQLEYDTQQVQTA
jgi:undecaprenyl diphosphate synthase